MKISNFYDCFSLWIKIFTFVVALSFWKIMTCVSDTHENTKLYPCIYIVSHVHPSAFKLIFMQTNFKKKIKQ